jgi:hypothetical protein
MAQALSFSDLPSAGEILGDMAQAEAKPLQSKLTPLPPPAKPLLSQPARAAMAPPRAAMSPMVLTPLAVPKPKIAPAQKASSNALLGDLSHLNLTGSSAALKIALPASIDGAELEVFVQIRQKNQVIAEGQIKKPAPGKGLVSKISVELKRG